MNRPEMIKRLVAIQNTPVAAAVDILTITGFMSDEQVAQHLARYESAELERVLRLRAHRAA